MKPSNTICVTDTGGAAKKEKTYPDIEDALEVTFKMKCIYSPNANRGKLLMKLSDTMADVKNAAGEHLGSIGMSLGAAYYADVNMDKGHGFALFMCNAREQWEAIAKALQEQYNIQPTPKKASQ